MSCFEICHKFSVRILMLIVKERIVKLNAGLSICPSGYLGSEDVGYCFRFKDDSPRQVSRQDAIQYCKQNGGKLLQLNLNEDQKLAIRLFAQLGLINTSGLYQKKSIKSFFLIFIESVLQNTSTIVCNCLREGCHLTLFMYHWSMEYVY